MKILFLWCCLIPGLLSTTLAVDKGKDDVINKVFIRKTSSVTSVNWAKQIQQGFNLKIWLSNQMAMGIQAWDAHLVPPNACANPGIGMEFPSGSCVEHLFGAGPVIGGLINGVRHVTEGYNGDDARMEFLPEKQDTARDKIWRTHTGVEENHPNGDGFNGYYFLHGIQTNRRYYDDDGDGKIDEDELDGQDNDGDWNPLTDDVGADGIPDSLEVGCTGELYNPVTNPDPAHDDYLPSMLDSCHPVSPGIFRLQNDKNLYTENNGIPDHGEPHVDEDYAAMSDQDFYMAATDTFKSYTVPNHFPMGIKVFQKTYAWKDPGAGGFIPMEYQFVNIGHNTIDQVYVGFFADFDIGPVNIASYGAHNYACYIPEVRCGYANNAQDRGSTPAGAVLLGASRPLDSLQLVWQWTGFSNPGTNDSAIYSLMDGESEPGSLIQPCQTPSAPTDSRIWFSVGPFPTMKPGDTLKLSVALVSGMSVTDMATNAQLALDMYNNNYVVGVRDDKSPLPSEYRLDQNYPNPFNPSTTIRYDVPKSVWVTLKIYDILGREVATLVNGMESPGYKQVTFNANSLPTGVYTYRLTAGSFVQTKKMMLMK